MCHQNFEHIKFSQIEMLQKLHGAEVKLTFHTKSDKTVSQETEKKLKELSLKVIRHDSF